MNEVNLHITYVILFSMTCVFALVYSIIFIAKLIDDYNTAEKAHKKMMDEKDFYL